MLTIKKITPSIGAEISGVDFSRPIEQGTRDQIYQTLLENLVIFFREADISPTAHLNFAQLFGQLDDPHPLYPHVENHNNIMLLENDSTAPPDTNSWHTDLTYKAEQPFASVLVARHIPEVGGDTLWSSNYAAYDRLSSGQKQDFETLDAIHDMGDFRNNFAIAKNGKSGAARLDESAGRMGHAIRPLIGQHPITGRKFLNFNEAFVTHIIGKTTNEATAIKTLLANHMNHPEDQLRWHWQNGDMAMWDNRVTMHYAVADYLPAYRCMHRITVVRDGNAQKASQAA